MIEWQFTVRVRMGKQMVVVTVEASRLLLIKKLVSDAGNGPATRKDIYIYPCRSSIFVTFSLNTLQFFFFSYVVKLNIGRSAKNLNLNCIQLIARIRVG